MESISYGGQSFFVERYPESSDRSLRAFAAADALLLDFYAGQVEDLLPEPFAFPPEGRTLLVHDRFGALAVSLHRNQPLSVGTFCSQEKALKTNFNRNNLEESAVEVVHPFDELPPLGRVLMRVPKSLDLFTLYLAMIARSANKDTVVAAGFMTRHFTPRLLEVAGKFARKVTQSKARKKARLLILSDWIKMDIHPQSLIREISFGDQVLRQFYGVFSADHIDYATQFLLSRFAEWQPLGTFESEQLNILDLACGNGVIGHFLRRNFPEARISLQDDAYLAIASARENLKGPGLQFIYDDVLDTFSDDHFDLVVTNPPFHFGHENNIEVSLRLFREAKRVLRPGGRLVIVANRHLNYFTHLQRIFPQVDTVDESDRFVIYAAVKEL